MRLDIQRLDERIKRLQEIRRIAADPEMASILTEFLVYEDARPDAAAPVDVNGTAPQAGPAVEVNDIVNEVVRGGDTHAGGGLWRRKA